MTDVVAEIMLEIPSHWEILERDMFFDDGRDYNKPMYARKDGKARVYHNAGEEGTKYEFAIATSDGDGECASSLSQAIKYADSMVEEAWLSPVGEETNA